MSLRGGLLAETTWALDTITIMLADDQTHTYFRLKQMPGLLPAIVDIYVKCLTQLFDEFQNSPSNIENQQPSLNDLNGSSHLTCTTRKKHEYRQQESIIYRVESNSLNKYKRKYNKEQSIVYDRVYDEQGNEKQDPTYILDLQNTDDLSYLRTHFDPLRLDDSFYEKLYYGHRIDETSTNSISDEHDQEPIKKSQISLRKRMKTSEDDLSINEITTYENSKCHHRRRHNSDSLTEISDSNKEFLERYKRKFEYDERQTYELYPGISSSLKQTMNKEFHSCTSSNDQQENASALFTYHSLAYDQICARCTCVSSILRNLSFILGNDIELVKSKTLIGLLARLLLLRHGINHNHMSDNQSSSLDETVNQDQSKINEQKSSPSFCWTECVLNIRENTLVTLANIAGTLVLDTFDSDLLYTLIDGLLHWATCYSGEAIDGLHSSIISAQRLAIEILTKLSVHEMNMDFILATPPFYRIVSLFHVLTDWLIVDDINGGISNWHPPSLSSSTHYYSNFSRPQTHIQREFAVVLLNALVRCDTLAASVIARIPYAVSLLLNFLEDYEMKTSEIMARYGPDYVIRLTTQPSNIPHAEQILFTTSDMLKRAATCLLSIVSYTDNIKMMKRYEDRILNLSTSHVIDSNVGRVLTDVLHYCSLHNS
jgi:AT-rich interactive domain-containing protein 1